MKNVHLESISSDLFLTLTYPYENIFLSMIHCILSHTNRIANIFQYYFLLKAYRLDMSKSYDFFPMKPTYSLLSTTYVMRYIFHFTIYRCNQCFFWKCFSLGQQMVRTKREKKTAWWNTLLFLLRIQRNSGS